MQTHERVHHQKVISDRKKEKQLEIHTKLKYKAGLKDFDAFSCDKCSKKFYREESLQNHQKMHSSVGRPYKCEYKGCNKYFRAKVDMQAHLNSNDHAREEDKPYACTVCNKRFGDRNNCNVHERISHIG